ncbi:hypothetical protein [Pararhizobium qamdonense]|uniref:hypothetical protein n=1 Tax=Pararhizobium qamdonense TaxID=3031126 RepID=UPI0023E1CEC8|nr:hypothetical protein [Pararhizobium qamdonense]
MSNIKLVGFTLLGFVGLGALSLASGAFSYVTAPFFGRVQAERQLESGASRVALYNQFFDLCAGVQALEGQMDVQTALYESQAGEDRNRTAVNIAGLNARRFQIITQYNADAAKSYTAARFLDAKLPYQLSLATYSGQTKTVCAQ